MRRMILPCLLFLPVSGLAESYARPETPADVVAMMQIQIERDGRVDEVINHGDALEVFLLGESRGTLNPDNLFFELRKVETDGDRGDIISHHVSVMLDNLLQPPELTLDETTLGRVMPVLRFRGYGDETGIAVLQTDFSPGLVIQYVLDSPDSVSVITANDLKSSGIEPERISGAAMGNLSQRRSDLGIGGDGIFYLEFDGYYESSFVLDMDLWRQIEAQIGPVMMAVPARDTVIFGPSEIPELPAILNQLASEISAENGGITSDEVFELTRDGWQLAHQ